MDLMVPSPGASTAECALAFFRAYARIADKVTLLGMEKRKSVPKLRYEVLESKKAEGGLAAAFNLLFEATFLEGMSRTVASPNADSTRSACSR
jgi:hypothetical protein